MVPYVVQYLSPSVQTIDTRTLIFSIFIQSTSFWSKLQELLDAFLIFWVDVTFIHQTSIHLSNNSVILKVIRCLKISLFYYRCGPIPFRKTVFYGSFIRQGYFFFKIWQNFGSISHWSPCTQHEISEINFPIIKYALRKQLEMHCTEISSN